MTGNQQDLARHLGVNKSSVCRAVKAGRITAEADGSYDFAKCTAAWHAGAGGRTDVAARHAAQRGAAIPKPQANAETPPAAEFTQSAASLGVDDSGRAKAKAATMHYENSAIKLEMALRRGLRYERAAARREAAGLGALLRAGVERVIDQTAPRLAAAGNDLERRRIVEREIRRLRWVFKRELPRSLRRMKEQGAGKVGAGGTAE
jgi:hypothetical protein